MGKIVLCNKPPLIRCTVCNKLKPDTREKFSHRGIDTAVRTRPLSWVVYQSGWKRIEELPLKRPQVKETGEISIYYHCPDCRSL